MINKQSATNTAVHGPAFRKLRGYAFDPSLSLNTDTFFINNITYKVPWEDELQTGPVGEYVEVIDYDPTIEKYYTPVDLDAEYLLAEDGLDPDENNPQFHQQMVYAVAMTTIKNFENALGRLVQWSPRRLADRKEFEKYVRKLRIYPHALRDANAYYSPQKKALLFGYFASNPAKNTLHMPGSFVYTCLSHDIIAHETTHAILDGMYPHYSEPTNADVLAFHEAFADIVALFQHFTFPEVLKHQIAKTRGDLASQNLLGELAQEFGSAIGNYGSLRSALGKKDPITKKWVPNEPTGEEYATIMEPHNRGSILVSAVFDAFLTIYKNRVSDLLRLATNGTGVLPAGDLHPDLVNRLANEASKSASHVLNMCIRALDYCPPVDITFGDYLRAIITADTDIVVDDDRNYRVAFIEAFRRRGMYPHGIKTLSMSSLGFQKNRLSHGIAELFGSITAQLRNYSNNVIYEKDREEIYKQTKAFIAKSEFEDMTPGGLHSSFMASFDNSIEFEQLTGLVFNSDWSYYGVRTSKSYKDKALGPSFRIQDLRLVSRVGPENKQINQIVFSIIQRSGVIINKGKFAGHFIPPDDPVEYEKGKFDFYGGCTLIFDLDSLELKYAISKPLLDIAKLKEAMKSQIPTQIKEIRKIDTARAEAQYRYQHEEAPMHLSEYTQYFSGGMANFLNEPFSFLHQH